jgi:hypothetical protein
MIDLFLGDEMVSFERAGPRNALSSRGRVAIRTSIDRKQKNRPEQDRLNAIDYDSV